MADFINQRPIKKEGKKQETKGNFAHCKVIFLTISPQGVNGPRRVRGREDQAAEHNTVYGNIGMQFDLPGSNKTKKVVKCGQKVNFPVVMRIFSTFFKWPLKGEEVHGGRDERHR